MAEEIDEELRGILHGPAKAGPDVLSQTPAVTSGAGVDELRTILHGEGYQPAPERRAGGAGEYFSSLGQLAAGGVKRNLEQWRAMPSSLGAIASELQGDTAGAQAKAQEAAGILKAAGEGEWNLQKVHDPESFSYWLAEKLGEQGITALATIGTGGLGGLGSAALARTLAEKGLLSEAGRRALMLGGMATPTYALSTAMETAGTSQEQFEVTGGVQPGLSAGAGAAKGLLELWAPLSIAKALMRPGLQLGKTLPGAVGKIAAKEGSTETAQEAIDITARKYNDPNYSYFKDGFTLAPSGWGEGAWRLAEAGAAGAAVGGVYGAPFAGAERAQVRRETEGPLAPGERQDVPRAAGWVPNLPQESAKRSDEVPKGFPGKKVDASDVISAPAVRVDGKIYTGVNHGEAYSKYEDEVIALEQSTKTPQQFKPMESGFLLTDGRFVSPEEAAKLVPKAKTKYLYSENLGGPGPITDLRRAVMTPQVGDKLPQESRGPSGRDDVMSLGPLLSTIPQTARDRWLDAVEANTTRYVREGSGNPADGVTLYTDTELELDQAINQPQSEAPRLLKVRQDLLQLGAITATIRDLPPVASGRVWFLKDVPQAIRSQLLQQYEALQAGVQQQYGANLATAETRAHFERQLGPIYNQLTSAGLRVVPSRGSGFHYNGVVEGEPVADVLTTERSRKIALYNPVTQQITPFVYDTEEAANVLLEDIGASVLVSVDRNKVQESDIVELEGESFKLKSPLDTTKLTPGISFIADPTTSGPFPPAQVLGWAAPNDLVQVEFIYPETEEFAKQIETWAKGTLPGLRKVLNALGIKEKLGIRITDGPRGDVGISPASAEADTGVVALYPRKIQEFIAKFSPGTDLKQFLTTALMHELGHLVTYHHYHRLPVEIKERLYYAWDKARLAFRMGDQSRTQSALNAQGLDQKYWTSFPEWLAEQFRRWSTSNADAKGWTDSALKGGAQALSKFYVQYERQVGTQKMVNLAEPDYYFSAFMDYVRGQHQPGIKNRLKRLVVRQAPKVNFASPAAQRVTQQVELALRSVQGIVPPGTMFRVSEALSPHIVPGMYTPASPGAYARWIPEMSLFEIAAGTLAPESAFDSSRQIITHEVMHAYEDLGIISPEDIAILMQDIRGKETQLFPLAAQADLRRRVKEYGDVHGWTEADVNAQFEMMRDKELRAYYIQQFADTGFAYSERGRSILSWILALFQRVKEFLQADGHRTSEDVVKSFFRGEMLAKYEPSATPVRQSAGIMYSVNPTWAEAPFDEQFQVGANKVNATYDMREKENKASALLINYIWLDPKGVPIGQIELLNRGERGYEISWIESDSFMLAPQMIQFAEQDLGFKMKVAAQLTEEGFKQTKAMLRMRGRQEGLLDLYTPVKLNVKRADGSRVEKLFYFSPHELRRKRAQLAEGILNDDLAGFEMTPDQAKAAYQKYTELLQKLPLGVWKDPRLEQMFSLARNAAKDGVEGSMLRSGQQVEESKFLSSMAAADPQADVWRQSFELSQHLSQAANARASGLSFDLSAPSSAITYEVRKLWERATGYGSSRAEERELINTAHEMDRIGKFSKYLWTLDQLIWANQPKLVNGQIVGPRELGGLFDLGQHKEQMNMLQNAWVTRADQTAKAWLQVTNQERRDAITNVLFSLSEMNYLSPAARAAKVSRLPTGWFEFLNGQPPPQGSELHAEFFKHKVRMVDHELIRKIHGDFSAFLSDVENVGKAVLGRKFANSPQVLQNAVMKLDAEMAEYRSKPYFPMMRFGEHITLVKEQGKLVASYAFPTISQRAAAMADIRQRFPAGDIQVGRISANQAEFMSLPGPLLKLIKENLFDKVGKSPDQIALIDKQISEIEELELLHIPDRTFRKRWMPSTGVPGYSMDAFRAYSHYFQYGSRYLSRMAFMDQLQDDISRLRQSMKSVGNMSKRAEIVKYAEDWLKYVLEPGRDSGKFRAIVSFWYLGFSPAAAFMNVTQNITTTWPWLSSKFGGAAQGAFVRATNARLWRNGLTAASFTGYQKAHEEMVRQGFIDMGQAPELAAFAEGHNLGKLMATSHTQKAWRNLSYAGMYMFAGVESYNREVAMRAAWDLATKNPQATVLKEIDLLYPLEISELQSRTGLTHTEAVAFMFAKDTIKRTQFVYDKTSDPPFMRGKAKDFLIFFKYTQGMLFAFGYNGAMVQMLLTMAFLYGLAGVPGAEDANEVLKLIAQRLFGKDFDILKSVRELIRGISRGTPFEQAAPDMALHGISRYGFGLGFLPDHWAAPKFDLSANGSMGRIVPGLYEAAHGMATGQKFADVFAQSAQRVSGAGYGTFYTIMQTLMEAPSAESHKWEQLLQRQLKALAKSYRYGVDPQAETTRQGAKIVQFKLDASDPDDVATVLAQAFGFTPLKVSKTWDAIRATKEEMAVWDMRRQALYVQMDRVLQERPVNSQALADMFKAITKYNADVPDPIYAIKGDQLRQSLVQRNKTRATQEQTLGANRREAVVSKRMQDLYGVEPPRPVK
jgi:hypothetical protein